MCAFTSCGFLSGLFSSNNQSQPQSAPAPAPQPQKTASIRISRPMNLDDARRDETTIVFDRFPGSLSEWERMRAQVKDAPEGILAMQLLAYELYRSNTTDGQRAVEKNSTSSAYRESMERLPEIFGKRNGGDNQYARPYIVWSYLDGSTPDNGYTPTSPYTLQVRERMNSKQWSELAGGYVYILEVYSNGYDTPWRAVQVILKDGQWYIYGCPALYTQCKKSRK